MDIRKITTRNGLDIAFTSVGLGTGPLVAPAAGDLAEQIHRQREHDGRGSVVRDVVQGGEVAELHRAWLACEHLGRLH